MKSQEAQCLKSERIAAMRLIEYMCVRFVIAAKPMHGINALQLERPMAVGFSMNEPFFGTCVAVGFENTPAIAHGLVGGGCAPGRT